MYSVEQYAIAIVLPCGLNPIVSPKDYPQVANYKWIVKKSCNTWYAVTKVKENGKIREVSMHRLLMKAAGGEIVDHINGNGLDNRDCNLRLATNAQNIQNSRIRKNNKSGYKGVHPVRDGWRAMIQFQRNKIHIGYFDNIEDAGRAYDIVASVLFKEFVRPNFPNSHRFRKKFQPYLDSVLTKVKKSGLHI